MRGFSERKPGMFLPAVSLIFTGSLIGLQGMFFRVEYPEDPEQICPVSVHSRTVAPTPKQHTNPLEIISEGPCFF